MALIKTGSLITDINGKIGGQSFQRSRQGLTLQNSPGHVNNASNILSFRRSQSKRFSQAWRSLSASQRLAWNNRSADPGPDKISFLLPIC